tara:strand:- start:659 stop:2065 length:1407 start_codon:yes stop_codon:yes gene_type:complete
MRVVIIGAGPGGYVAAVRAAQLGARVTVVEQGWVGGACLHWGCIPSKALLSCRDVLAKVQLASEFGIQISGAISVDLQAMVNRKNKIVSTLASGVRTLLKSWSIQLIEGRAALLDRQTVRIIGTEGKENTVSADAIVIATGAQAATVKNLPIDGDYIVTSKELLDLSDIPKTLLIVGAGVEGCEFASLFAGLGSHVVVIEVASRVLPSEDIEVSSHIQAAFKKQKIDLHLETQVVKVKKVNSNVQVTFSNGTTIETDKVLVAVGRHINPQGLGLENVGVAVGKRGEITVNKYLETTISGIYAIGDVIGKSMLAHVASYHGKVVAENIMGNLMEVDHNVIPSGIFTAPEVGRVGITEDEARKRGIPTRIGRFRSIGLGKAHAQGETVGLFKVIADAGTDRLLGVHIVGAHAADLIHEAALGMRLGATAKTLATTIHAHPTWAEGLMEAAEDVSGEAIHLARKRISAAAR